MSDDSTAVARLTAFVRLAVFETRHVADCRAVLAILAAAKAEALRDAADAWAEGEWNDTFLASDVVDDESAARATTAWLEARADRIAQPPGERDE